jgi:hypothetical protein
VTDDRLVLVHTVPFTDPDQLRKASTAVAWVRKLVHDLDTEGTSTSWQADRVHERMEQLMDAQLLLDGLVMACLVELGADRKHP